MTALEARKRLLVLESDLNRTLLAADLESLRSGIVWVKEVKRWAPSFRQGLALAAPMAALLRRKRPKPKERDQNQGGGWSARVADGVRLLWPVLLFAARRWRTSQAKLES